MIILASFSISAIAANSVAVAAEQSEAKPLKLSPEMKEAMESKTRKLDDGLTTWQRIKKYVISGFLHIVPMGIDHILFVLGLFLSTLVFKRLIWQVTVFTLAHSITLGMAAAGWVSVSASVVEPLIALSIAYLAFENIRHKEPEHSRLFVIFLFGLLHGLGFAFVLQEFGLPQQAFLTALFAFNIGVEVGQVFVLACAFLLFFKWSKHPTYRKYVQIPGSAIIGLIGMFWVFERTIG